MIDDARSHFEFCLCDRVGYRRGGMALVSVRLCRLDIQALIHTGDAADRFRGDWRDGLSTRILRTIACLGECRGLRFACAAARFERLIAAIFEARLAILFHSRLPSFIKRALAPRRPNSH